MSTTILIIGLMVFFAHFLSLQFKRTNIPDVLILMLVGILLGPLFGIVTPDDFGKMGSLLATIALVVILFESGTSLDLKTMSKAFGLTLTMTLACFALTSAIIGAVGFYLLKLQLMPSIMLGVILGGNSSAIVIPLVNALKPAEKPAAVLVLESAMTDVLCIIGLFALLQVNTQGNVIAGHLVGSVLAALLFAAIIGFFGGIGWLLVLGRVRDFPNTISSTLAYAFIVYGFAELLGFSGAIAALALGVSLSNYEKFGLKRLQKLEYQMEPLNEIDRTFFRESVFLLKTYFFVYLGVSIHFGKVNIALLAIVMVVLVFLMRIILTRILFRDEGYNLRDTALTSMMAPKGLAAAVLATLPLQYGVDGGGIIRDVTYMVVFFSVTLSAILVAIYPLRGVRYAYKILLRKPLHIDVPPIDR